MKKLLLFILLAGLLAGCGSNPTFENVSVEKAKELIDGEKVTVIDVRTLDEYNEGHIPGSQLIPLPELKDRTGELEKDSPYLIVCRSGNRSAQASEILIDNGFKNIYNLEKGMNEWKYDVK